MTDFVLDRLNVNDDEYMLIRLLCKDGDHVEQGTAIAEFETSKAAIEIEAAASGPIYFLAQAGQVVRVGAPLYRIGGAPPEVVPPAKPAEAAAPARTPPPLSDLVEADDDTPGLGYRVGRSYRAPRPRRGFSGQEGIFAPERRTEVSHRPPPYVGEDPRKEAEVANLSVVNPSGLVSCLFARCSGTVRRVPQDGMFEENVADLIIYEAARLMARYPLLNAFYDENSGLEQHETVAFGYSIDVNDDLAVYTLGACETMSLPDIRAALEGAMEAHVTRKLSRTHLQLSTITLTDLSGSGVRHFFPLINGRQSAILGYSDDEDGAVLLSLSFDHRAIGGRYVARFLEELVARLDSHLMSRADAEPAPVVECAFCGVGADMLRRLRQRGLMRIVTPSGEEALCCETCFTMT